MKRNIYLFSSLDVIVYETMTIRELIENKFFRSTSIEQMKNKINL